MVLHTPGANFDCAGPAYFLMSAAAPLLTRVGSAWYSAWNRSGGVPALSAVRTLVTSSSPWACLLTVTWMSGCAVFQVSTTLSIPGTQDQNVNSTFFDPVSDGLSEPHAAVDSRRVPAVTPRRIARDFNLMCSPTPLSPCERWLRP